jgi:hypothetical protein
MRVWKGGPVLLVLYPAPVWAWKQCSLCQRWINGYYLSINHHAREHAERKEGEPHFTSAIRSASLSRN